MVEMIVASCSLETMESHSSITLELRERREVGRSSCSSSQGVDMVGTRGVVAASSSGGANSSQEEVLDSELEGCVEKDGGRSEDREEVEGQELEADNFNVGTDEEDEKDMVDEGNSEQELEVKQPEGMVEENSSELSSSTGAGQVGRGVAGWQHNLAPSLTPQVFLQLDVQAD